MRLAIAQMRIYAGEPRRNLKTMLDYISQAKSAQAELIIFPELCISGLLVGDNRQLPSFVEDCLAAGEEVAAASHGIQVVFGNYFREEDDELGNGVFLASEGALYPLNGLLGENVIAGTYDDFLVSWISEPGQIRLEGRDWLPGFPLGDWQPELLLAQRLQEDEPRSWLDDDLPPELEAAQLIIDITCRPLTAQGLKAPDWQRPYLRVNGFGLQSSGKTNYLFPGGSCWVDRDGELIASAPWFQDGLFIWSDQQPSVVPAPTGAELLAQGLVCGVRCFAEQAGIQRAVIGMSGGIDSALAGCVYRQALGAENVFAVSLPTRFNSQATQSLAQRLAQGLELPFAVLPIENSSLALQEAIEGAAFRQGDRQVQFTLSPGARENVMARERCRALAALAAACGGIFTCNGNKAELSVGYATFYGDLAGAFAAQADLWKYQVYQAAAYFQQQFPDAPLAEIAALRPSAELSAAQAVDKGLGDPLIYAYHDYLLRSWVEGGQEPLDNLEAYAAGRLEKLIGCAEGLTRQLFPDTAAFCADLEHWWRCYRGLAIAKRLQAPPLLAMSPQPFGEPRGQVQATPFFGELYEEVKGGLLA